MGRGGFSEIIAQNVGTIFVNTWEARLGVLFYIITDRSRQFSELSKIIGFHRLRTTSYHLQANGLIERAHRTLKAAIIARKEPWLSVPSIVLLGIRIRHKRIDLLAIYSSNVVLCASYKTVNVTRITMRYQTW